MNSAGAPIAAYTWGAAGLVSENLSSGSLWYHYGPQGETRHLTGATATATGTVAASYVYDPWGSAVSSTGADPNPFRYGGSVGYYTDPAAEGLVLCGQRWYAPGYARWLSRDPAGYGGGANLYAYCGDDPVGGCDPEGTAPKPATNPGLLPPGPGGAERLPPGYDPKTWTNGTLPDRNPNIPPKPYVQSPDGTKWLPDPSSPGHWPHYDVLSPGKPNTRYPEDSLQPKCNQKRPPYGNQSATDPWSNVSKVGTVAAGSGVGVLVGIGVYEAGKWVVAVLTVPETAGLSLVAAGSTP